MRMRSRFSRLRLLRFAGADRASELSVIGDCGPAEWPSARRREQADLAHPFFRNLLVVAKQCPPSLPAMLLNRLRSLALILSMAAQSGGLAAEDGQAVGTVFEDKNGNGLREAGERGLKGVAVSNQREIAMTDGDGRWTLPLLPEGETTFFVIKPRDFAPPTDAQRLPRFAYTHKPAGSPKLKYPGLSPTGQLPVSIDFPLSRQKEPDSFQAIFFGDTQPRDLTEVGYFKHDIVDELIGTTRAKFGVTLGDIVFDDLSVMEPHNAAVALIGLPWWNVIGNHDVNADAPVRADFDDTYNRIYGPSYFSFNYGPVHFVSLNNINFQAPETRGTNSPTWKAGLEPRQVEWLAKDLELVPEKQLVVLMMHVPLDDMTNRTEVYRLLERRPYSFSISGHTHWHEHRIIRREDGWLGATPHHHVVNVTACGSWWTGQPDESGIPHTTMRDGAPNGYSVLTFEDRGVTVDFKAARRPANYQLNIMAPDRVSAKATNAVIVHVNVFNGSDQSTVKMRLNNRGAWTALQKALEPDPDYVAAVEREAKLAAKPFRELSKPIRSPHLWKGTLPKDLPKGTHNICVEATDGNGKLHPAMRAITVE